MKNRNFEKVLVLGLTMMFVGAGTLLTTAGTIEERQSSIDYTTTFMYINSRGTLYVGGTGEGNYSTIQDAIDNASEEDTVFVYNGTYYEHVTINKNNITLTGENRQTTIIDAGGYNTGINIPEYSHYNFVSGFTVRNTTYAAIYIYSALAHSDATCNYNTISDCVVHDCTGPEDQAGIKIYASLGTCHADYNTVMNCIIYNTTIGISVEANGNANASHNKILNSICYDNENGIKFIGNQYFQDNIIVNCTVYNNSDYGIYTQNIDLENYIYHNNLINNDQNAYDDGTKIQWYNANLGEGNYYDDYSGEDSDGDGIGDTPYDIPGEGNQDEYPLINPWGENLPIADFSYTKDGLTVLFDGSLSYDRDGEIISYEWDFGDGNNGTGMNVNHTYDASGTYDVTLIVIDNDGYEGNTIKIIEVEEVNLPPDTPEIDGPPSGKTGTEYEFTFNAYDPNGDDVKYFIDWGDNTTDETDFKASGTDVKVKHTWDKKGDYTIKAKAIDVFDAESELSTFKITIPKNKSSNINFNLFSWFLKRFPLLERLLSFINTKIVS